MLGADTDVVGALAREGIPCAVFAAPGEPVHLSRRVVASLEWVDAWKEPGKAVELVRAFALRQSCPPVLLPQTDGDLLALSRRRDRLAGVARFNLPDATVVEDLIDKARFRCLAERLGLPVPTSERARPDATGPPEDLTVRPPLVVKPLLKDYAEWDRFEGSAKARRAATAGDLAALWPELARAGLDVLLQEEVPGPESLIESYHAYLSGDGELVAEFTGRKLRTFPTQFGHTTALTITAQADVIDLGREVVERVGLTGPVKVDFKRAPDGALHLLELNPRFNLWHGPAAAAGVNFPAIAYAELAGLPRPSCGPARPGVTWCSPLDDARAARQAGTGTRAWLRFAATCDVRCGLSRADWRPAVKGMIAPYIAQRVRAALHRTT